MKEEPRATAYPRGLEDEFPEGPPTVVVTHRGYRLVLRFAEGDFAGEGLVQKLELLPGSAELKPRVLRQFAPDAEVYLAYARAAMRIFGPEDTPEIRRARFHDAAEALRKLGGPGRGLTPEFFRMISEEYRALVDGGEPHPVKSLGEIHYVTIAAASRWVTEARRRGLIETKEASGA